MTEYTHTLEIMTGEQSFIGELSLNDKNPRMKVLADLDCPIEWENKMHNILNAIIDFNRVSGDITKIELVKKL